MQNNQQKINKHYIYGASIVGVSLVILPFAMLVMQTYMLPYFGNMILGSAGAGTPEISEAVGSQISVDIARARGDISKAEIVMVEYSDYECFFCNKFHPTIKSVFEKSNSKIAWVYKHFPLEQIHPNAKPAAISSECVAKLGGKDNFWKYTDTLLANNKNFSTSYFEIEAVKLGVNLNSFKSCVVDPKMGEIVDRDLAEGASLGVNGTPNTMIVQKDGDSYVVLESINGALDENAVQAIVNKYIK